MKYHIKFLSQTFTKSFLHVKHFAGFFANANFTFHNGVHSSRVVTQEERDQVSQNHLVVGGQAGI